MKVQGKACSGSYCEALHMVPAPLTSPGHGTSTWAACALVGDHSWAQSLLQAGPISRSRCVPPGILDLTLRSVFCRGGGSPEPCAGELPLARHKTATTLCVMNLIPRLPSQCTHRMQPHLFNSQPESDCQVSPPGCRHSMQPHLFTSQPESDCQVSPHRAYTGCSPTSSPLSQSLTARSALAVQTQHAASPLQLSARV